MKNALIACLFCCCAAFGLQARNFKPAAPSAADVFSGEGTPVVAEGDIDGDGVKDLAVAVPGYVDGTNFAFYFGNAQGGYTLFRDYETDVYGDRIDLSITDKGVVRIAYEFSAGADIFLFRFENGDFRLIGGKEDRHRTPEDYDISYNYLTGKMIRTEGKGRSRTSTTLGMPAQPKILFGWIPLRYDMLGYLVEENEEGAMSPDDMLVMGIFRVMQSNEMLFWHFCDYENPYRDPVPGQGGWTASDEHMSPGSYNFFATLDITRQADGSYLLELSETSVDRSFESELNEDLSNMPENAYEEESSETTWVFRDGRFTELPSPQA